MIDLMDGKSASIMCVTGSTGVRFVVKTSESVGQCRVSTVTGMKGLSCACEEKDATCATCGRSVACVEPSEVAPKAVPSGEHKFTPSEVVRSLLS